MSAREWQPGDVAVDSDGDMFFVVAGRCPDYHPHGLHRHYMSDASGALYGHISGHAARPLLVIDPEDREQVERLARAIAKDARLMAGWTSELDIVSSTRRALLGLIEPPRPEEPTTWAVVEASCVHSDERRNWIHHDDGNWWPAEKYGDATAHLDTGRDPRLPDDWDSLLQPVVIREGVTP